jgi:L-amino acid N-acyltransferase YncA
MCSVPGAPFGARHRRDQAVECTARVPTTTADFGSCPTTLRGVSDPPATPRNSSPGSPSRSTAHSTPSTVSVRPATLDDAAAVRAIYNVEVENHLSTFDLVPRTLEEQRTWISARSGAFSAVVAVLDGEVVGFASLSPYKERAAYRTTVEDSVYVSREHPRRGIGRALMDHVVGIARDSGFHAVMARIEASGTASRALHEACGFELIGVEREVGRKFNRWLDVAVYQLML